MSPASVALSFTDSSIDRRSFKLQAPSSREAPNFKPPICPVCRLSTVAQNCSPEGRKKIAHRFIGGYWQPANPSPVRDERNAPADFHQSILFGAWDLKFPWSLVFEVWSFFRKVDCCLYFAFLRPMRCLLFAILSLSIPSLARDLPTVPVGLDAYGQWDLWPQQRIGVRAYMRSTSDRGGGMEGAVPSHFLYQTADDFNVTLDVAGPGILYFARYNHWHGSPWHYEIDGVRHTLRSE